MRPRPLLAATAVGVTVLAVALASPTSASAPRVLRVGSWHGVKGTYPSIQAAVDAARPGDWVLVGPGDWKERGDHTTHKPAKGEAGWGVTIDVPRLHLRGMDRNRVVVDGTLPGTPTCSARAADQDLGTTPAGRSGIVVAWVDHVSIENLTACNFLGEGNEIWWDGGDATGKIGMGPYYGAYLSATSTYFGGGDKPQATYGIFVSNARGPGLITRTYASNMTDASYYIGACPDCNAVLDRAWAENSALGYSGTNSGGHLVIQNSEWDENQSGIVTNSQNNDDAPSPQDGSCPSGTGPTGTTSCEIWRNNYVHDNNNPNVPQGTGVASAGPVGTGMVIAGGRFDTIVGNRFVNNKAWGVLTTPYPDSEIPPSDIGQHCQGGIVDTPLTATVFGGTGVVPCYFSDWGNEIAHNTFTDNGGFGNPTNGDVADISSTPPEDPSAPGNCWHDNTDTRGTLTQWPQSLSVTNATCGAPVYPDPVEESLLIAEALCDSNFLQQASSSLPACSLPPGTPGNYPQTTKVVMKPLPAHLASMPDPCAGVPANPWCPAKSGGTGGSRRSAGSTLARTGLTAGLPATAVALLAAGAAMRRRSHRNRRLRSL